MDDCRRAARKPCRPSNAPRTSQIDGTRPQIATVAPRPCSERRPAIPRGRRQIRFAPVSDRDGDVAFRITHSQIVKTVGDARG
jgi:hypothetical protein